VLLVVVTGTQTLLTARARLTFNRNVDHHSQIKHWVPVGTGVYSHLCIDSYCNAYI
jgi:hypothetical protein